MFDKDEIIRYWHIARTALDNPSRYDRMQYVKREYLKAHPEFNVRDYKRLWLAIGEYTRVY
jgi:hypothetical protein